MKFQWVVALVASSVVLASQTLRADDDVPMLASGAPQASLAQGPGQAETALTACYGLVRPDGGDVPSVQITVGAEIGSAGELVGIPTLIEPATPDAVARRMFQQVLAALDLCAPPPGEPLPAELEGSSRPLLGFASQAVQITVGAQQVVAVTSAAGSVAPPPSTVGPLIVAPQAEPARTWQSANEQSQARLNLSRQGIRDLQARLLVLGFDPNGVDGAVGRGTRAAISAWQQSNDIPVTGYVDAAQLDELRRQSEPQLAVWLADPANRRLHEPPAPVAITPAAVSGRWNYTATCGRNTRFPGQRITGVIEIASRGGGSFSGSASNSQGQRGSLSARLDGRTLQATIRWGLLAGSTNFTAQFSDDARSASGRDSLGCSLTFRKR